MPLGFFKILLLVLGISLLTSPSARADAPLAWADCVRETAAQNPDLQASVQAVRKSLQQVGASRSDFFPTLTGFAGYNVSDSSNFRTSPDSPDPGIDVDVGVRSQFEVGVNFDQNIFAGLKTQANYNRTKSLVEQARADLDLSKAQVSFDLKSAFARLLFSQEQLEVVRRIVKRREENVRFVELRFDVGRENQGSVLRNKALLDQAQFELAQTQRALRVAQRALAKVLGRNYEKSFETLAVKGDFKTHFPQEKVDFQLLVPQTPAHRKAAAQLQTSKSDVKIARGDLLPSVDAEASVAHDIQNDSRGGTLWSAGINLNYPFATGGRDIYELRGARAEQFRTQFNLESVDNQAGVDIKQSYADFKDAVYNIRVQQDFLKAAAVRAEIGRAQYANGLISYQDWDLVENDLINNQRTILESQRDALIAEAAWEKALGKGAIP